MVYVPSAEAFGFSLKLHEDVMRDVLNSPGVKGALKQSADKVRAGIVTHVQATASVKNASNYVAAMFQEDSFSDDYGFDFGGPYELGNRPVEIIGIPAGAGPNPNAKPPLMVEADTHALTAGFGVTVGGLGEDIR